MLRVAILCDVCVVIVYFLHGANRGRKPKPRGDGRRGMGESLQ